MMTDIYGDAVPDGGKFDCGDVGKLVAERNRYRAERNIARDQVDADGVTIQRQVAVISRQIDVIDGLRADVKRLGAALDAMHEVKERALDRIVGLCDRCHDGKVEIVRLNDQIAALTAEVDTLRAELSHATGQAEALGKLAAKRDGELSRLMDALRTLKEALDES